jgi:predicted nicotinamide N-methyase
MWITAGTHVWSAALVFARWIASMHIEFDGKTVLELGAGCGLPGLSASVYSQPKEVC